MTITQDVRTRRKHRGKTPWQLVQTIGRLEREADDASCQLVALATEIDELKAARAQVATEREQEALANGKTLDDLVDERDYWRNEALRLRAKFSTQLAAEANEHSIDVPPAVRPIDGPEDQATAPTNVRPLWDALGIRAVSDPGRVA